MGWGRTQGGIAIGTRVDGSAGRGLDELRAAVARALGGWTAAATPALAGGAPTPGPATRRTSTPRPGGPDALAMTAASTEDGSTARRYGDGGLAASSEESEGDRSRLIALVELARGGDAEAFGLLYDHYQGQVYRFLYYRTRSVPLAEDLTSETFFRALRRVQDFRWQGKDFGAWLMTIARNLATDHFKSGRARLESPTEDMTQHDDTTEGPEAAVLASLTNELLLEALAELPTEQRDCLVMRFLQGMSIAETAGVLGRSDGAVKQLQLRGVRNLAKLMPEGVRGT